MEDLSFIGLVRLFFGATAPANYLFCEGQTLTINGNETLFSVIGSSFGGDGRSNFQLPNYEPEQAAKYIICVKGTFPSRS